MNCQVDGIYQDTYERAIASGENEVAARVLADMAVAVWSDRRLLCRTMASGSLALYEPETGNVVEIIREAVDGFDAFAHIAPSEHEDGFF